MNTWGGFTTVSGLIFSRETCDVTILSITRQRKGAGPPLGTITYHTKAYSLEFERRADGETF